MKKLAKIFALVMALVLMVSIVAMPASAVTVTGVSGVEVTATTTGSSNPCITESSGTVTVTATGTVVTRKQTTVTITNTSGSTATISFDYSVSNHDSSVSTIDDLAGADSGSYSVLLTAGATKSFVVSSARGLSTTATATLKNFKVEAAASNSNVTVTYGSLGSVTMDGTAISSGSVNSVSSAAGATFAATANSGATFLGWVNTADSSVISTSASFTYIPTEDIAIKAVFASASAEPVFWADDSAKLIEGWDAAISYASSASNKVINLAANGTLPSGSYNIPSGVTVNIPYDSANTLCTTKPTSHDDAYTAPSVYRTLNMASGASITVNGALSLSGSQSSKYFYNGMPSGPLSFIKMASGSKISVESGAYLYAWGYVTGSGSVEVKSGGTVYECFQIADYRGGDATTAIVNNADTYGVFPFNQYYLQNVEVPMTLYAGAADTGFTAVTVTMAGTQTSEIPFVGTDTSMFTLSNGYIIKDYKEGTGRTEIAVYGDIQIQTISMSMKVSLIGTVDIDSSKYALPIPQHFTVDVVSGDIALNQSIAFLPGSEMTIREGASCTLGAGKKIIVFDLDQWPISTTTDSGLTIKGYSGTTNLAYIKLKYVPGGDGTTGRLKDAQIRIDGVINAENAFVYTTAGGANIYSTGTGVLNLGTVGTETVAYQVITDNTDIDSWPEIAISPAVVQDGDGTDVSTAVAGTYTYYADTQKWCVPGHRYESAVTAPTCTEDGYTTHTCIACGDSYTDTAVTATGHSYTSVVTEATCENGGYTTHTCSVCSHSYTDSETESLGHNASQVAGKDATCTETGLTDGWYCDRCEKMIEEQEVIPALGHNEVTDAAVAATCENPGLTEGKHCDRCGEVLVAQTETEALGHSYNAVTTEPTCTAAGKTVYTCGTCGDSYEEEIKALGHSYGDWTVTAAPTYTVAGSQSKTCATCGDVVTGEIAVLENPVTGYNVVLGDEISLHFVMTLADADVVAVTVNGTAVEHTVTDGKICVALAAAQMNDTVAISVNGMALANTYSVRGYADVILAGDYDDAAKALVKAMLHYGAAAQTAFGYNAENLANADIETVEVTVPADRASTVSYTGEVDGVVFYGASLSHRNKIAVRFYFTGDNAASAVYKIGDTEYTAVSGNGMYYIEVADINPQDLDEVITVTVSDALTVTYAPMDYIVRMYNKYEDGNATKALALALYGYHAAAKAYVG